MAPSIEGKGRRPRILLACSGLVFRRQLAAALEGNGYAVTGCHDGHKAAMQLRTVHYHLVLTAVALPDWDGLELIRELRHLPLAPPVVAFAEDAGAMSEIYLNCATALGARWVHRAPLDIAAIVENVGHILAADPGSILPPL